ncbi:hypothetical protein B0H21DRAFT_333740 [Amylocystis lapponica]|nr:hypothetical protein B0H21DRAFT_333740 [Amylocystis lapponica]
MIVAALMHPAACAALPTPSALSFLSLRGRLCRRTSTFVSLTFIGFEQAVRHGLQCITMMHLPDTQRELRRRHAKVLERDPSLLNLPVPIPSVPVLSPILDPILSPLVAGTTPQSTAPADQSPSPSGVSSEDSSPSSTARATSSSPPPPLISLPIPLPSIPILSPLLSPLIGGSEPSSSAQAQDTPTPITTQGAPIPIATQIPSIPGLSGNSGGDQSGSEGSSGGGSGDGSAGGDSNNGAGASNGVGTDSGDGDSGDTGDGGESPSDGGTSGGNGVAGGFSPASPSEGPGAHSSNTPGVSGGSHGPHGGPSTSSPFRPTSIANTPGNISSAVAGSGTTGVPSSASGESASSLGASETSSGFEPVANVHDGAVVSTTSSGGSTSGTVSYRSGRPVATGTLTSSGVRPGSSATSNTSGPGVDGNGSPSQLPSSADSKHGLPKGVLAVVIAIAVLLSLGLLVCCVRKRAVAKRKSSRKWFFGGAGQVYGNPAISSSQYFRDHPSSTRTDSALSFGTPIDQGTMREVSPSEAMLPTLALKSSEQFWQETPNDPILAPSAAFISDNDPSPSSEVLDPVLGAIPAAATVPGRVSHRFLFPSTF